MWQMQLVVIVAIYSNVDLTYPAKKKNSPCENGTTENVNNLSST